MGSIRRGTTETVRNFWEAESCGERYGGPGALDYQLVDEERYSLEPMIPHFARFSEPFSGRGLEIGLGTGADFSRNVSRGGAWVGIDLTQRSLGHVRRRLGSEQALIHGDAQVLPIRSGTFDLVYSWGVLLCCPSIESAIDEVHRVLVPGGTALIMLYHARSWVALAAWLRWGWWRMLSPRQAVSYMESPGTQAFSINSAKEMFSVFRTVKIRPIHTSWDTRWLGPVGKLGGDRMGWFLLCEATK